jgi:hypothetical protein
MFDLYLPSFVDLNVSFVIFSILKLDGWSY